MVLSARAALLGPALLGAALAVAALAVTGCGNGLTPGDTANDPMFSIFGIGVIGEEIPASANPVVGLIWSDPLQRRADITMPARWMTSEVHVGDLSTAGFLTRIFRPPPPAAIVTIESAAAIADPTSPSADWIDLAVGDLVIVDDVDGDGAFSVSGPRAEIAAPDRYLAATQQGLVYVARPFALAQFGFPLGTLVAGYQLIDYQCMGQVSHGPLPAGGAIFQNQPSTSLPELRNCERTHSP